MSESSNQIEALKRARELLTRGWTRKTLSRDEFGVPCSEKSELATCWCALGAVARVEDDDKAFLAVVELLDIEAANFGFPSIEALNDDQEAVEPVLALFDRAIARLEAEATT